MRLPSISIVTPSFNSAPFIGATIRSVLDQHYPDLEYLVLDGGSTDGTLDILKKYASQGLKWISEADKGQSDAINKGFRKARGEIVAWINSNDVYLPGSFEAIGRFFTGHPEVDLVFGRTYLIDERGATIGDYPESGTAEINLVENTRPLGHYDRLLNFNSGWIPQQSAFWKRERMIQCGYLNEQLHYAMDYEYWLRLGKGGTIQYLDAWLAGFRMHKEAKSLNARRHWTEILRIRWQYRGRIFCPIHARFAQVCFDAVKKRIPIGR